MKGNFLTGRIKIEETFTGGSRGRAKEVYFRNPVKGDHL